MCTLTHTTGWGNWCPITPTLQWKDGPVPRVLTPLHRRHQFESIIPPMTKQSIVIKFPNTIVQAKKATFLEHKCQIPFHGNPANQTGWPYQATTSTYQSLVERLNLKSPSWKTSIPSLDSQVTSKFKGRHQQLPITNRGAVRFRLGLRSKCQVYQEKKENKIRIINLCTSRPTYIFHH